jgi:hypothetical protein
LIKIFTDANLQLHTAMQKTIKFMLFNDGAATVTDHDDVFVVEYDVDGGDDDVDDGFE